MPGCSSGLIPQCAAVTRGPTFGRVVSFPRNVRHACCRGLIWARRIIDKHVTVHVKASAAFLSNCDLACLSTFRFCYKLFSREWAISLTRGSAPSFLFALQRAAAAEVP